jgi:putative Mg2+ transporter-C (MgtC) family protein
MEVLWSAYPDDISHKDCIQPVGRACQMERMIRIMNIFSMEYLSILLRLVAAMVLGGLVGLERAGKSHDAGLRTHILVCIGSAAVMVLSECLVRQYNINAEIMRMGAQVISGIGFLGVGTIIVSGDKVKGLTTAAGLWTTACVGLVVGAGYYAIAITVVALMLFAMLCLRPLTLYIYRRSSMTTIGLEVTEGFSMLDFLDYIKDMEIHVESVNISDKTGERLYKIQLELNAKKSIVEKELFDLIKKVDNIKEISVL